MTIITRNAKQRSITSDILKAIAMIVVIVYHVSTLPYTYISVDIFLVISGYWFIKSTVPKVERGELKFFSFLFGRLVRLWPVLLLTVAVSLGVGFFTMLPDDLENLGQSALASVFFGNNTLSCITTGNYWNTANDYKPLMHTWYLGILVQAYVVLLLIFRGVQQFCKKNRRQWIIGITVALTVISMVLYVLPQFKYADKYYYLHFRMFEILLGACAAFLPPRENRISAKLSWCLSAAFLVILFLLMGVEAIPVSDTVRLIISVTMVAGILYITPERENHTVIERVFACIGRASYSIFLWYQPVLAFTRYLFTDRISGWVLVIDVLLIAALGFATYYAVEIPFGKVAKDRKGYIRMLAGCIIAGVVLSAAGGILYLRAGVIQDIPELDITTTSYQRGQHAAYNDRVYKWDRDFSNDSKIKILIVGDSTGRDWANILSESAIADKIEISYIYHYSDDYVLERRERFEQADKVFCATYPKDGVEYSLPEYLSLVTDPDTVYVVGVKNFGKSNGIVYNHRHRADYFESTVEPVEKVVIADRQGKEKYGDRYVDILSTVRKEDGTVSIFTPDHKFISQDCLHLTKSGAQFFAKELDLDWITQK